MVVIKFNGGLGNQLFQYSLYKKLELEGKDVYADLSFYKRKIRKNREFVLEKLGIKLNMIEFGNITYFLIGRITVLDRVVLLISKGLYLYLEDDTIFNGAIYFLDNRYYIGHWQNENYFKDIIDQLRKNIVFPELNTMDNRRIRDDIKQTNSISIHIRRGDYVEQDAIYGRICTEEYYTRSIQYFLDNFNNCKFFVFTNDIEWARMQFDQEMYTIVDNNSEAEGYHDMHLMSLCKHNIIANSSFSWWAAWLNENSEKVVIAPSKWTNKKKESHEICKEWIKL